jgi:hypothetical protein
MNIAKHNTNSHNKTTMRPGFTVMNISSTISVRILQNYPIRIKYSSEYSDWLFLFSSTRPGLTVETLLSTHFVPVHFVRYSMIVQSDHCIYWIHLSDSTLFEYEIRVRTEKF